MLKVEIGNKLAIRGWLSGAGSCFFLAYVEPKYVFFFCAGKISGEAPTLLDIPSKNHVYKADALDGSSQDAGHPPLACPAPL